MLKGFGLSTLGGGGAGNVNVLLDEEGVLIGLPDMMLPLSTCEDECLSGLALVNEWSLWLLGTSIPDIRCPEGSWET